MVQTCQSQPLRSTALWRSSCYLERLLNHNANVALNFSMSGRCLNYHGVQRYWSSMSFDISLEWILRFSRGIPKTWTKFPNLMETSHHAPRLRWGAQLADRLFWMRCPVSFVSLEELRKNHGQRAAYDCANLFGDSKDQEDRHSICHLRLSLIYCACQLKMELLTYSLHLSCHPCPLVDRRSEPPPEDRH